jgi:hypothetical protein
MNTQISWERARPRRAKAAAKAKVQVLFDLETGRVIPGTGVPPVGAGFHVWLAWPTTLFVGPSLRDRSHLGGALEDHAGALRFRILKNRMPIRRAKLVAFARTMTMSDFRNP